MRDALRYFSSKDPYQAQKIEEAYEVQMERLRGAEQLPGGAPPDESPPTESADGSNKLVKKRRPAQQSPRRDRSPITNPKGPSLKSSVFSQSNDVPDQQLLEISR